MKFLVIRFIKQYFKVKNGNKNTSVIIVCYVIIIGNISYTNIFVIRVIKTLTMGTLISY